MDQQEQSLIDRIKQAQNVLVTVSVNPSVDQLAAAIGLAVALNKLDKHGTAVFSGQVPSTIEFLKPEETLEKNTDSLRDFIIALNKSKADKLRYKVEDQVVRIFITPYKTSLSEKDLEFSQGDFNVDVVIALGVAQQQDIDAAISAHGRILHDATVASISLAAGQGDLGTINWVDESASSLSEMMLSFIDGLDKKLLDNQIATALLTGIVASTDRFRNEKTSPKAMSASAELMAAGANQQLIATELEAPPPPPEPEPTPVEEPPQPEAIEQPAPPPPPPPSKAGEIEIDHGDDEAQDESGAEDENKAPAGPFGPFGPTPSVDADSGSSPNSDPDSNSSPTSELSSNSEEEEQKEPEPEQPQVDIEDDGTFLPAPQGPPPEISQVHGVKGDGGMEESDPAEDHLKEMPSLENADTAAPNNAPEDPDSSTEELTLPSVSPPLLKHDEPMLPAAPALPVTPTDDPFIPQAPLQSAPEQWQPPEPPEASPVPAFPAENLAPMPSAPDPSSVPVPDPTPPPMDPPADPSGPLVPLPPPPPPISPASASLRPGETLSDIEQNVRSSHVQAVDKAAVPGSNVEDARSAVQAAFDGGSGASVNGPLQPIVALNAQPLGPELHSGSQPPPNAGFNEPTPGNTPADATLDMPMPANPFGPGQQGMSPFPSAAPPSAFPGVPPSGQGSGQLPPPPVPPPMLPPF